MLKVQTEGFEKTIRQMAEMPQVIRKVVVGAIAETASDVKKAEELGIENAFANPTPWIKKSIRVKAPSQRTGTTVGEAMVYVLPKQGKVLKPHVFGGQRPRKPNEFEFAQSVHGSGRGMAVMSTNWPKNQYHDIAKHWYQKALADVKQSAGTYAQKAASQKRTASGRDFFVYYRNGYAIGIAQRQAKGIKMMLKFVQGASYQVRFDFEGIARKQIAYSLPANFNRIFARYASRL